MFTISDVRYKINIKIRVVAKFAALLYYDKKNLYQKKKQENAFVNNVHWWLFQYARKILKKR